MYLQHKTESRCNWVTPIMQPCAAVAHISWTRASRETWLCTIPMLALSHCLEISREKKIHKYCNTVIQLSHCDSECCWKEHHVQSCKYKSLHDTRLTLRYSNAWNEQQLKSLMATLFAAGLPSHYQAITRWFLDGLRPAKKSTILEVEKC